MQSAECNLFLLLDSLHFLTRIWIRRTIIHQPQTNLQLSRFTFHPVCVLSRGCFISSVLVLYLFRDFIYSWNSTTVRYKWRIVNLAERQTSNRDGRITGRLLKSEARATLSLSLSLSFFPLYYIPAYPMQQVCSGRMQNSRSCPENLRRRSRQSLRGLPRISKKSEKLESTRDYKSASSAPGDKQ